MRLMGELVGPSGRVTGIDMDAALGSEALAALRTSGGCQFDFVAGDAMAEMPGQPFRTVPMWAGC